MPKTYVLECPEQCSLRPGTPVGIKVTEWLLEKKTYRWIIAEVARVDDYILYPSTMTRHKKHIVVTGLAADKSVENVRYKASNVEILETIIQKGFQNAPNWKPTISDTMKAMDMWFRLTQGSPFDDLLNTLASAAIGEEEPPEANPDAVSLPDEGEGLEEGEEDLAAASA